MRPGFLNHAACATLAAALSSALPPALHAAEVVVQVRGAASDAGSVGCSLFSSAQGFPMDSRSARQLWVPVAQGSALCRFEDVAPGTYAISVGHDLNGNRRVDTNFLGIPTEGWGVSNNVVPSLRAPRFEEAAFKVEGDAPVALDIRIVN